MPDNQGVADTQGGIPVLSTLTVVCTLLPTLLLLRYFYSRDLNPGPHRVLLLTFVLGACMALPVALLETAVWRGLGGHFSTAWSLGLTVAFLVAALPEEYYKFLVLCSLAGFVLAAGVASFQWLLAIRRLRDLELLQLATARMMASGGRQPPDGVASSGG